MLNKGTKRQRGAIRSKGIEMESIWVLFILDGVANNGISKLNEMWDVLLAFTILLKISV